MDRYTIGRSLDHDLVLHNLHVSRLHAWLDVDDGTYILRDADSANGTYVNGERVKQAELYYDDIVSLSEHVSLPAQMLISQAVASTGQDRDEKQQIASTERSIKIGRGADCDLMLPSLRVAELHALVDVQPNGERILSDVSGNPGLWVNGALLRSEKIHLRPDDHIEIAGTTVSVEFRADSAETRLAAQAEGVFLRASDISWSVGERSILNSISLAAYPGEVIGIMGPSGGGKTSLIDILCGRRLATSGAIFVAGREMSANRGNLVSSIGYVPQDDVLHSELTVREELYFQARLRLPSTTSKEAIGATIESICERLMLTEVLDSLIGSPQRKTLSGGQRKRVSIAIELLTDPRVLFLDEPTSGLSSRDARLVMELVRELARERAVPVVVTIHQPSLRTYRLLDHVLYLREGCLAYFGPTIPESLHYFSQGEMLQEPDEVMEQLEHRTPTELATRYASDSLHKKYLVERTKRIEGLERTTSAVVPPAKQRIFQFSLLTSRYLIQLRRARAVVGIALLQALVVGALVGLSFVDQFPLNTALFIISFVPIWLSTNNAAREIVADRAILEREERGGLSIGAYIGSIVVGQFLLAVCQNVIMVFLALVIIGLEIPFLTAMLLCTAGSVTGLGLGLLISALARDEVSALIAVPLVLIPFILLGGALVPYSKMAPALRAAATVVPSRWSYEAFMSAEQRQLINLDDKAKAEIMDRVLAKEAPEPIYPSFTDESQFFTAEEHGERVWIACAALLLSGGLYLFLAFGKLLRDFK